MEKNQKVDKRVIKDHMIKNQIIYPKESSTFNSETQKYQNYKDKKRTSSHS